MDVFKNETSYRNRGTYMLLLIIFCILILVLAVPPITYYIWMNKQSKKTWSVNYDENYQPKVTLIISTYNEAKVISSRLENLQKLDYPEKNLEVIVVDSASTDGTLDRCKAFLANNKSRFPIRLLSEEKRCGKSHALNYALEYANGEIIATSDADSFWEPDALKKVIAFFADSSIGAATGREKLSNLEKSIHTMSEGLYRKFYYTLREGESKLHSTLIFQGELSLYRRSAFAKFEDKAGYADDTGTIIGIISKGYRCIFVSESVFYDTAAFSLEGRLMLKSRRAQHLIAGVIQSLRFKLNGTIKVPLSIILFNFYLHVLSPIIFFLTIAVGIVTYVYYFPTLYWLALLLIPVILIKKLRLFIISYFTSNIALVMGMILHSRRTRSTSWRKIEEMR